MKIKRSVLEKIIREELVNHIKEMMNEASNDPKSKVPDLVDADSEKKKKEKPGGKGDEAPTRPQASSEPVKQSNGKQTPKNDKTGSKQELPVGEDPEADKELDKDVADPAAEEDAADVTGGKIADEINGRTIQSVSMEPKSKILPGAQEITITFREIPDPLKILVTKSGAVKFHFRGIHNSL